MRRAEKLKMVRVFMDTVERQLARENALEAFGFGRVFTNRYYCKECANEWTSVWDCACDDQCHSCGVVYTPVDYTIEDEFEEEVLNPNEQET